MRELIQTLIAFITVLGMFAITLTGCGYTQRFIKNSDDTATSGIWFTDTIVLSQYKYLGKGNGLFGSRLNYTRSDRHGEVISVYLK